MLTKYRSTNHKRIALLNKKQSKYQNDKCAARSSTISSMEYWSDGPLFDLAKTLKLKADWQAGGRNKTKSEKTCMDVSRGQ